VGVDDEKSKQQVAERKLETGRKSPERNSLLVEGSREEVTAVILI
jgi:hypothetical protein